MEMEQEIRAVLARAGWHDGEYAVARRGDQVVVALGLGVTSPNAASSLVNTLLGAGLRVRADVPAGSEWRPLAAGKELPVTRWACTSRTLACRLYGVDTPSRHQVTSASQWAARRGIAPVQPGARVLLWPATEVDAALAERAERRAAGKSNVGNRTSGEARKEAARRGWETRRALTGDGSA
jgi:hypothetical protein